MCVTVCVTQLNSLGIACGWVVNIITCSIIYMHLHTSCIIIYLCVNTSGEIHLKAPKVFLTFTALLYPGPFEQAIQKAWVQGHPVLKFVVILSPDLSLALVVCLLLMWCFQLLWYSFSVCYYLGHFNLILCFLGPTDPRSEPLQNLC